MKKYCALKLDKYLNRIISIEVVMKLDSNSTKAVSVKNYKIRISRSDFTHIHEYLCRISFLTTLDIYKDYFKGHHMMMQLDAK